MTQSTIHKTQADTILDHLMTGAVVTPMISTGVFGISRLSAVIEDIRQRGVEIDMVTKWDALGRQYGEYRIRRPITVGCKVQVKRGAGIGLPNWVRRLSHSKVVEQSGRDAFLVQFIRGKNNKTYWLNDKELVRVD